MNILITGGLGFVGRYLCRVLLDRGHHVTAVGLSPSQNILQHEKLTYVSADTSKPGPWQYLLPEQDSIINLAGVSIFNRWNEDYKKAIYDSRILTTRNIVQGISERCKILCSTSAIGYYGPHSDEEITEETGYGNDFLARVCQDWENEALKAQNKKVRVVITRFGVVLGKNGGALQMMIPAFRMFLGGKLGSGKQWFSWIHMTDLINGIYFLMANDKMSGAYNFVAPNPIRNQEMAAILGKVLSRPSFLPVPEFALRIFLGEMGNTLLKGQRAIPSRLAMNGFQFQFPELKGALEDLLKNENKNEDKNEDKNTYKNEAKNEDKNENKNVR